MSSDLSPERGSARREAAESRAARRTLLLAVVAIAAALVGAVVWAFDPAGHETTTESSGSSSVVDEIGPQPGTPLASYVTARQERLTEVEGRRAAVVSFTEYLTDDQAGRLLGSTVDVAARLIAIPGGEARRATSVVDERAAAVAEAKDQLHEIGALVPTVEDEAFAEFYRAELIRYREIVGAGGQDDIVFGALVVGRAADLRAIASQPGVRLVDVGDGSRFAADSVIRGLRPEESVTAGEPPFRP